MDRRPRLALALAAATAVVVMSAPASAGAEPAWKCRASVAYAASPGEDRIEPFVANGNPNTSQTGADRERCADDLAQVTGDQAVGPLEQSNPFARTEVQPDTGPSAAQVVSADARADATTVKSPDGGFTLSTADVQAHADARCIGGTPVLSGSSGVASVTINGQPVVLDGTLEQVGTGLNGSPVGGLIRVTFNEEERTETSLVRRAVHVRITDASGAVVFEAVAAEASVGRDDAVCVGDTSGGGAPVCPNGSEYDGPSGLCVRIVTVRSSGDSGENGNCPDGFTPTGDGNCIRAIPVDDDGNPLGGSIVPLDQVPAAAKSICRNKRFGKKLVAIRGTNRRDNITGTNKSDRMFVLGGNDLVSGGRGNDCLEGGRGVNRLDGSTGSDYLLGDRSRDALIGGSGADRLFGRGGNDRLSGGFGNDRLSGSSGRDKLVGGPGNDTLAGGSGNDSFDLGTGRDRVSGGAGNDKVNAANAGAGSRIDCGPGRDTVRVNRVRGKRLKRCERVFVLTRRR